MHRAEFFFIFVFFNLVISFSGMEDIVLFYFIFWDDMY